MPSGMAVEQQTASLLALLLRLLAARHAGRHLFHRRGGQRPAHPPLEVLVVLTDVGVRPVVAVLELTVVMTAGVTQSVRSSLEPMHLEVAEFDPCGAPFTWREHDSHRTGITPDRD